MSLRASTDRTTYRVSMVWTGSCGWPATADHRCCKQHLCSSQAPHIDAGHLTRRGDSTAVAYLGSVCHTVCPLVGPYRCRATRGSEQQLCCCRLALQGQTRGRRQAGWKIAAAAGPRGRFSRRQNMMLLTREKCDPRGGGFSAFHENPPLIC